MCFYILITYYLIFLVFILYRRITNEVATNADLQKKLQEITSDNEKLEVKIEELKKNIQTNKESAKKMNEENLKLQKELTNVTAVLKSEQERPWWKNAGELAMAPLNALQNAAYIMLPAIPAVVTKTTSTSDMPKNVS